MARETLTAVTALDDYRFSVDSFTMAEIPDIRLLSMGYALSDSKQVAMYLSSTWSLELPSVGFRTAAIDNSPADSVHRTALAMQQDQLWLLGSSSDHKITSSGTKHSDAPVWLTDQSDAWVMIDIRGSRCVQVLERLCSLDLDIQHFTTDKVARTVFEHMSVVIVRRSADHFQLLTPRSSAASFVHALSHAATHVVNESVVRLTT